jgi:hypothetical protein
MPYPSNTFKGGRRHLKVTIPLGTGAVSTQTKIVGAFPTKWRTARIRYFGQAAVTGTSITAEVFARTTAGAAGSTLQSAATDIKFASAAAAKAGTTASLTATVANLSGADGQLTEVVVTATSITAGPGDLLVSIEFDPQP